VGGCVCMRNAGGGLLVKMEIQFVKVPPLSSPLADPTFGASSIFTTSDEISDIITYNTQCSSYHAVWRVYALKPPSHSQLQGGSYTALLTRTLHPANTPEEHFPPSPPPSPPGRPYSAHDPLCPTQKWLQHYCSPHPPPVSPCYKSAVPNATHSTPHTSCGNGGMVS
jgi:hypothetical protein